MNDSAEFLRIPSDLLAGDVSRDTLAALWTDIDDALIAAAGQPSLVILDFTKVSGVDAGGRAALTSIAQFCSDSGKRSALVLENVNHELADEFAETEFDQVCMVQRGPFQA